MSVRASGYGTAFATLLRTARCALQWSRARFAVERTEPFASAAETPAAKRLRHIVDNGETDRWLPFPVPGARIEAADGETVVKTCDGRALAVNSRLPVAQIWRDLDGKQSIDQVRRCLAEKQQTSAGRARRLADQTLAALAAFAAIDFATATPPHLTDIAGPAGAVDDDVDGLRLLYIDEMEPDETKGFGFPRARRILGFLRDLGMHVSVFGTRASPSQQNGSGDESAQKLSRLRDYLRTHAGRFDAVWVSRLRNLRLLLDARGDLDPAVPVIFDSEAVVALRDFARMEAEGKVPEVSERDRILNEELDAVKEADVVLTVSASERDLLAAAHVGPVYCLGSPYEPAPTARRFAERSGVFFLNGLFLGTRRHEAVDYLVGDIVPRLGSRPDIALWLYGYGSEGLELPRLDDESDRRVHIGGFVEDLAQVYAKHRVAVISTRFASGVPWKAIECMAHGVPLVVTPLIAEQLGVGEDHVLIGRDPAGFAASIEQLYDDEALWQRLRDRCLDYVREQCSPETSRELIRLIGRWVRYRGGLAVRVDGSPASGS